MKSIRISLFFLVCTLVSMSAWAAAPGSIELQAVAQVQKTTVDKDGTKHTQLVPAQRVVPGEEIVYTLNYHNISSKPVDNVVMNDPVPEHMTYVGGSATGENTTIAYSIDGGKTWGGDLEQLVVKNADGTTRAATDKDCTDVRWTVNRPVAAGAKGSVSFRAVLL